jgi:hypothetical protein
LEEELCASTSHEAFFRAESKLKASARWINNTKGSHDAIPEQPREKNFLARSDKVADLVTEIMGNQ